MLWTVALEMCQFLQEFLRDKRGQSRVMYLFLSEEVLFLHPLLGHEGMMPMPPTLNHCYRCDGNTLFHDEARRRSQEAV